MALADYTNPVEKIAALKAAQLDPALVNVGLYADGHYDVTEDIYVFFESVELTRYHDYPNDPTYMYYYSDDQFPTLKFVNGETLSGYNFLLFVKDSEITYADPITTYQSRLSSIFTTAPTVVRNPNTIITGAYGSIILNSYDLTYNSVRCIWNGTMIPIPIPTNVTIGGFGSDDGVRYFDVPADW